MRFTGGLTLLLSLACAVASASEQTVVRIDRDGWPSKLDAVPRQIGAGEAIWTWSDDCGPRRVAAGGEDNCPASIEVTVQVATPPKRQAAPIEVRWGSEPMIREIPDSMLPVVRADATGRANLRVPAGGKVFARVAGPLFASGWQPLRGGVVRLNASAGLRRSIEISGCGSRPAQHSRLTIREHGTPTEDGLSIVSVGGAVLDVPIMPAEWFVRAVATSEGCAPLVMSSGLHALKTRLELPDGFSLRGRLLDERGKPVKDARLNASYLVPGDPNPFVIVTTSGTRGTFELNGVPAADVELVITADSFARSARVIRVKEPIDLGDVPLTRARSVRLLVMGADGSRVKAATITTGSGLKSTTDASGMATLTGVPVDAFTMRIRAPRYLEQKATIPSEVPGTVKVVLIRAAVVRGRVIDSSDAPAGPGSVAVDLNGRKTIEGFGSDGVFLIDGLRSGKVTLEIRAGGLAPLRIPPRGIREGEEIDLGVLKLERGAVVSGRLVDSESFAPLSGATVRVLRPTSFGPALAYVQHDWESSESASDGTFELRGLGPGSYTLWTEAAGRAPFVRSGIVVGTADSLQRRDLGDLAVPAGHTLGLTCKPVDRCGTDAKLILADADWLPLQSPLHEGEASIAPVPSGAARLQVSDRTGVIHEEDVTISADQPVTQVKLDLPSLKISGTVRRGGRPVSGGSIEFVLASGGQRRFIQVATERSSGSIGNEIIGSVPRRLTAIVGDDGRFEVSDGAPGEYDVTWSLAGATTPPRRVSVNESMPPLVIDYSSGAIDGIIRTADGGTPKRTAVTAEIPGRRLTTIASVDGTFSFDGLDPGRVVVRAIDVNKSRGESTADVEEGRTSHLEITLEGGGDQSVTVRAVIAAQPVANAFVFLATPSGLPSATTTGDGTATIEIGASRLRAPLAAYQPAFGWTFLPARDFEAGSEATVDLRAGRGAIVVRPEAPGFVTIQSPGGFPLHDALAALGFRVVGSRAAPVSVGGLPDGAYVVGCLGVTKTVSIHGDAVTVDF